MQPLYITRAGVIGTLVALGVAALCVRLGVWQLDRLDQRRVRNAAIAERMHVEPRTFDAAVDADTTGMLYRRITLHGRYDLDRSVILPGRSHMGRTGAHLVTPLGLDDGGAVLVNRGWIPAVDPTTIDLSIYTVDDDAARIEAVLLPFPSDLGTATADDDTGEETVVMGSPDDRAGDREASAADRRDDAFARIHYRMDPRAIGARLPYPIYGAYARAIIGAGSDGDEGGGDRPVALPPPSLDEGPHLGYALQWFSFATIALVGWIILAVRRGEVGRRD